MIIEDGGIVDHSRFLTFRRRWVLDQLQELGPEVWRSVRSHRSVRWKGLCSDRRNRLLVLQRVLSLSFSVVGNDLVSGSLAGR